MRIHWFAITVHRDFEYCVDLWDHYFSGSLGYLQSSLRAGRGFQRLDVALHEAKLYSSPIQQKSFENKEFCHFEFTGTACDCLIPTVFQDFCAFLQSDGIEFSITRLDLAFDNLAFTPFEFLDQLKSNNVVSIAKRKTINVDSSPFERRENDELGCDTVYFGSKLSQRFLRVYNKRGFTRLELVCKSDRALAVALDIFEHSYIDWDFVAREHLVQYVNFPEWKLWTDFIHNATSADIIITSARRTSLSRLDNWLRRQVSVALSVYVDVHGVHEGFEKIKEMVNHARAEKDRSRYAAVLQLEQPFINLRSLSVPDIHDFIDSIEFPSPFAGSGGLYV